VSTSICDRHNIPANCTLRDGRDRCSENTYYLACVESRAYPIPLAYYGAHTFKADDARRKEENE